jgi:hypothetical protein
LYRSFSHFTKSVEGTPPEILSIFDKNNFSDDPGSQKCLFKEGKYFDKAESFILVPTKQGLVMLTAVVYVPVPVV